MKVFGKILTLVVLVSMLAACAPAATVVPATAEVVAPTEAVVAVATEAPSTTEVPAATEIPLTAAEQWAKDNGLGPYQPATEDWAAIEAAAKKEGKVVVYANSSKFEKLLDKWAELYPDIALDGGDTDGISTKIRAEQEAGNVVGDVWFNSDGHLLYGEFMPNQWLWSFLPSDVIEPEVTADRPFAISRHSVDVWGYNQEIHPEGCPLTNWWQLVDPALKGKIYMEDPIANSSTTAKITLIVEHADQLAAAYQEFYGKDWSTDEDAGPDDFGLAAENAGYLFLRKVARNVVIEPGGDEVDTAYASLGMDPSVEPGYGLTGWDSYETTLDGELAMAPCMTLKPVLGILKSNYLAIANNAPHPNAAKLFIKFLLSEDGFDPWKKIGVYSAVEGVEPEEGMPPMNEVALWPSDDAFAWANNSTVRDFWAVSLLAAPQE